MTPHTIESHLHRHEFERVGDEMKSGKEFLCQIKLPNCSGELNNETFFLKCHVD